jgi:hypothetical protein
MSIIRVIKPLKFNSVLIQTQSRETLCKIFIRFQEHYEGLKFRGKIFTLGQLRHWYSVKYGANTYYRDWSGFNFPSYVLNPFKNGLFDPLTEEEVALLELFRYRDDNFYIIGANNDNVTKHELTHALYWYNTKYKQDIDSLCKKYSVQLSKISRYLLNRGYHKDVINDELQAYITDNGDEFISTNLSIDIVNKFKRIQRKYWYVTKTSRKIDK